MFQVIKMKIIQIFQAEISREIHQIMERHTRTTLLPAIENLRKNGHVVDESVLNGLYCNILEAAKKPYQKDPEPMPPICTNGNGFLDINSQEHENNLKVIQISNRIKNEKLYFSILENIWKIFADCFQKRTFQNYFNRYNGSN